MDYFVKKTELLSKQAQVIKKYNELFQEVNELVIGMQDLLEQTKEQENLQEWAKYMVYNEDVDKTFRLATALQYVEFPDEKSSVENLKSNMKINKIKKKMPNTKK